MRPLSNFETGRGCLFLFQYSSHDSKTKNYRLDSLQTILISVGPVQWDKSNFKRGLSPRIATSRGSWQIYFSQFDFNPICVYTTDTKKKKWKNYLKKKRSEMRKLSILSKLEIEGFSSRNK
jgi:hypothetical protein